VFPTSRTKREDGNKMDKYERINRELIHKGAIIDYYQDTVKIPNGNVAKWDFIKHKGAAAVIPVTEDGRIIMVRQYRNALDRETLEIPAGGLNSTEEPTDAAAMRELEEETGYKTDKLELLLSLRTTVAFCNEKINTWM
jgi:ADP-ribose pyrophosphatase